MPGLSRGTSTVNFFGCFGLIGVKEAGRATDRLRADREKDCFGHPACASCSRRSNWVIVVGR